MPVLPSAFSPPPLLGNGHVQTILPVLFPRRFSLNFEKERLELEDGDFLDLDWLRNGAGTGRLALLSHGLEGCSTQGYILGMADTLAKGGFDVLAWNFRGCGTETNRLLRFYHSGETRDLARIIAHAAPAYSQIVLIGFSLGGNITLKYLGETDPHPLVSAAAAISVPVDLVSTAATLDRRKGNRFYLQRFLRTLVEKIEVKARNFPDRIDTAHLRRIRSFQEFDDRYTARLHGFRDAMDYWSQSSSRQFLPRITVPTLLLNARNDPFLDEPSFPYPEAEGNPHLFLETPASGGHVGFIDFQEGLRPWSEKRVAEWLSAAG